MGSPIESVLLYNRLQSVIGIRGVQKKDQKEKYTASGILNPKDSSVRSILVKRGFYTTCKSKPLSSWVPGLNCQCKISITETADVYNHALLEFHPTRAVLL